MTQHIPAGTWNIDPTHSTVGFKVRHLAISKVKGRFQTFSGTITTGETLEASRAEGTVEVASVTTNQEQRDQHLRTGDFFAADEFPEIAFRSTKVTQDDEELKVEGDFTMRGVTKPVVFEVEDVNVITEQQAGGTRMGFEAKAVVNRTDFGVNFNSTLETGGVMLGEDVTIELDIEAVLAQ